eukprot:gb/GECH01004361.1/.p1 GENE.gb/GECH01004361.1/~~gb/GECH01004361.1/.p1  ORF type:complete len:163 (+),score=27.38 gb/GECH01004361.1/:1-489(+)
MTDGDTKDITQNEDIKEGREPDIGSNGRSHPVEKTPETAECGTHDGGPEQENDGSGKNIRRKKRKRTHALVPNSAHAHYQDRDAILVDVTARIGVGDDTVSRVHCAIVLDADTNTFYLLNYSKNGTAVDHDLVFDQVVPLTSTTHVLGMGRQQVKFRSRLKH